MCIYHINLVTMCCLLIVWWTFGTSCPRMIFSWTVVLVFSTIWILIWSVLTSACCLDETWYLNLCIALWSILWLTWFVNIGEVHLNVTCGTSVYNAWYSYFKAPYFTAIEVYKFVICRVCLLICVVHTLETSNSLDCNPWYVRVYCMVLWYIYLSHTVHLVVTSRTSAF